MTSVNTWTGGKRKSVHRQLVGASLTNLRMEADWPAAAAGRVSMEVIRALGVDETATALFKVLE